MKVKYYDPRLPDGYEIQVGEVKVVFINNESIDVDQEIIDDYEARTGLKFADLLDGTKFGGKGKAKSLKAKNADPPVEVLDKKPVADVKEDK